MPEAARILTPSEPGFSVTYTPECGSIRALGMAGSGRCWLLLGHEARRTADDAIVEAIAFKKGDELKSRVTLKKLETLA